jgi:septum formation protein
LASKSPRRVQLLQEAGFQFDVVPSGVDESQFEAKGLDAETLAQRLALAKAQAVAGRFPDSIVLGADTLVDCQGRIIGKPIDIDDAQAILRQLFGCAHRVITGLALVRMRDRTEVVARDVTTVYPKRMMESDISEQLKSRSWQGKAGAYAIQEDGDRFVERLDGSLSNVIGLPMELLTELMGRIQ